MMDTKTVEQWVQKAGFDTERSDECTLRIVPRDPKHAALPPFFVQLGEHWLLLSILPIFPLDTELPHDINRRLLSVNRDIRIAKFALGDEDEIILCAELPTESLDDSELGDAVERMVKYFGHYREYLTQL